MVQYLETLIFLCFKANMGHSQGYRNVAFLYYPQNARAIEAAAAIVRADLLLME